jgi:hypothetical protein
LNHLWQRFLLASSLVVGLAIGVAATVFGYSNLSTVDIRWSVFHVNGVPLWTVAVVPITFLLVAGTVYHWIDGLHHFTEHMRHRHRVHELEAEVGRLRAHLDQVLEMPRGEALPAKSGARISLPAADLGEADLAMSMIEPIDQAAPASPAAEVDTKTSTPKPSSDRKKRARLALEPKPDADAPAEHTNGADAEPEPALPAQEA